MASSCSQKTLCKETPGRGRTLHRTNKGKVRTWGSPHSPSFSKAVAFPLSRSWSSFSPRRSIISSPHGMTPLSPRISASLVHDQNDHRIPPSFGCYPTQLLLNLLGFSLMTKRNLTSVFFVNLCQLDLWSFWLSALTFVSSHWKSKFSTELHV